MQRRRPLMLEGGGQALNYAKTKKQDVSFISCISWILSPYSQTPYCISLGILQRVGFSNFSPARSETASPVPGNTRTIHGESVQKFALSPLLPTNLPCSYHDTHAGGGATCEGTCETHQRLENYGEGVSKRCSAAIRSLPDNIQRKLFRPH